MRKFCHLTLFHPTVIFKKTQKTSWLGKILISPIQGTVTIKKKMGSMKSESDTELVLNLIFEYHYRLLKF